MLKPGEHGSTFGGNPLACAVARAALRVLVEEGMIENAAKMGEYLMAALRAIDSPLVKEIRGRGLMVAVELIPTPGGRASVLRGAEGRGGSCARKPTTLSFASCRR